MLKSGHSCLIIVCFYQNDNRICMNGVGSSQLPGLAELIEISPSVQYSMEPVSVHCSLYSLSSSVREE